MEKKKPAQYIYELVKSLSKQEKRYFRMQTNLQSGDKTYLQLYDLVDGMSVFDEEDFKARVKKQKLRNIQEKIGYLSSVIIKSLRSQYEDKSIEDKLRNLLATAEVMQERGFYYRYDALLKEAKKIAKEYEHLTTWLEILDKEVRSIFFMGIDSKGVETVKKRYEQMETVREWLANKIDYRQLLHTLYLYGEYEIPKDNTPAEKRKKLKKYFEHPLLQEEKSALSFEAKKSFYFAYCVLERHVDNRVAACHQYRNIVELWEAHPLLKENEKRNFMADLSNYLVQCIEIRDHAEFRTKMATLRSLDANNFDEEADLFHHTYRAEMMYRLNVPDSADPMELVPDMRQGLDKYKSILNGKRWSNMYLTITALYLTTEQYDEIFSLAEMIKSHKDFKRDEYLKIFADTFLLVATYEKNKKHPDHLDKATQSVHRSWQRKPEGQEVKSAISSLFRKLANCPDDQAQRQVLFAEAATELQRLENKYGEDTIYGLHEIKLWVFSKRDGKPLIDLCK